MSNDDLKDFSMLGLFIMESETQAQALNNGLLALEKTPEKTSEIEPLMRAAHSLKGGAQIVQADKIVKFAHAMEDYFVAVMKGKIKLDPDAMDKLFEGVDLIKQISETKEEDFEAFLSDNSEKLTSLGDTYIAMREGRSAKNSNPAEAQTISAPVPQDPEERELNEEEIDSIISPKKELTAQPPAEAKKEEQVSAATFKNTVDKAPLAISADNHPEAHAEMSKKTAGKDNFVKVASNKMEELLGLAGESFVNLKNLRSLESKLTRLKKDFSELMLKTEEHYNNLKEEQSENISAEDISEMRDRFNTFYWGISDFSNEFSDFSLRSESFSDDLYNELVSCKIINFEELAKVFPRTVRDVARKLGKEVNFEISGEKTGVDRDILDKLEAPLNHLIRNAIDHGIESAEERLGKGKSPAGTLKLSAFHWAGMLNITVSDDGSGIDMELLKKRIMEKGLATADMLKNMPHHELMEFLFLPGFSTSSKVTEISGRGVGLDVVLNTIQELRGSVNVESKLGSGTTFRLQLPITLSVISAMIVEIGNELYAFPSTRIEHMLTMPQTSINTLENRQYLETDSGNIGIVSAREVLGYPIHGLEEDSVSLLIVSDRYNRYAVAVDKFLREEKIVVRPLDDRLGKIPCISASAVLDDGSPVLIADTDDIVRSIDNLVKGNGLHKISREEASSAVRKRRKRVLVIDDSITVRELEKHLLENKGYLVETAVDGVDGWNAVRTQSYDIIVTDIDMPRMNGFELVEKIKTNVKLRSLPVMIVSYKDREEDRLRGIDAGADYYLTKSSFHDNTLLDAVYKLIGDPV